MKINFIVFTLCFSTFLLFSNCENEVISVEKKEPIIKYLSCIDIRCPSSNNLGKIVSSDDYLYGYTYDNDTLKIEFKFSNTCASAYNDSTSINGIIVYISLDDTSKVHARCSCIHESTFWYHVVDTDVINLILDIRPYTKDDFITCVDTLLYLN